MTNVYTIQRQGKEADFSDGWINTRTPWVFTSLEKAEAAFQNAHGHRRLVKVGDQSRRTGSDGPEAGLTPAPTPRGFGSGASPISNSDQ